MRIFSDDFLPEDLEDDYDGIPDMSTLEDIEDLEEEDLDIEDDDYIPEEEEDYFPIGDGEDDEEGIDNFLPHE